MKYIGYFSLLLCFILSFGNAHAQFRIVGYLNTWDNFPKSAATIDYRQITHMNIAFANPDAKGNVTTFAGLPQVADNAHQSNVKVLMSLGGAELSGTKKNWIYLTLPQNVQGFCNKLLAYVNDNHLDGIDVDLEGDIIGKNYGGFIHTLAATFHPEGKLITSAVATWFEQQIPASTFADFDFVNIMSYDETGPWDTTHPGPHSPYYKAVDDLNFWAAKGLPATKTNLGVPFYGWGFYNKASQNEYAYKDIVAQYKGAEFTDKAADTIYYNGMVTIERKTKLAMQQAGGIMIWQLTEDAEGKKSLLNEINRTSRNKMDSMATATQRIYLPGSFAPQRADIVR